MMEFVAQLRAEGIEARLLLADLLISDPADVARQAIKVYGSLDGIVNCAGVQHFGPGADESATAKKKIMRQCGLHVVDSPAEIGQAVLKAMGR